MEHRKELRVFATAFASIGYAFGALLLFAAVMCASDSGHGVGGCG